VLAGAVAALPAQAQQDQRCFEETGFCISGRIREFWEQNDGLRTFGFPTTPQRIEQIDGQGFEVQWFQRNRLELHPENARPYDVQLGRLGDEVLLQQGRSWWTFPNSGPQDGCLSFEETQKNLCEPFLSAWRANGLELDGAPGISEAESRALFGMPISPVQTEEIEGQPYQVQWFERARFELHPDSNAPFQTLFGLLGNELREATAAQQPGDEPAPPPPSTALIAFHTQRNGTFDIYTMNRDGSAQARLTQSDANDAFASWSYDGSRIAFASDRSGNLDLFVMNNDGTNVQQLTTNPGRDASPSWSPDNNLITYVSEVDGNSDIYVVTADGQQNFRLTDAESVERDPVWSPDGTRIVYASDLDGADFDIYSMNPDGSDKRRLTDNAANDAYPSWSPDSSKIAFSSGRDGNWEIYMMNADGSDERRLTEVAESDLSPSWSPDSSQIAFSSYRDGNWEIYVMDINTLAQVRLTNQPARDDAPTWSPLR
jgi:Tol biopolymer transport system component